MTSQHSLKQKIRHAFRLDRALKIVWQAAPFYTIVNLVMIIVLGVFPLLILYLLKLIIDAVTIAMSAPDKMVQFQHVGFLIALAAGAALLNAVFQLILNIVKEAQSLTLTDHMYDILHAKSIEVDLEYYENPQYFDTLRRAQREGPFRPTHTLNGLVALGQNGISLAAMAGLLFYFHWSIAAILFLSVIPGILLRIKYSTKLYQWERQRTQTERMADYFSWILTGSTHAKELRLFNFGNLFQHRFNVLRKTLRLEKLHIAKSRSLADFAAQAVTLLPVFGSYAFIAYRTIQGAITLGDMVMFFQAFQRGLTYLRELLSGFAGMYEDNLFLYNFFEFMDLTSKITEPAYPKSVPRPIEKGIVFDHVSFKYPSSSHHVLEDISLTIKPNEVIALVGENGSGKTTLIKLLCRLYDPTGGIITFDNIDLRQFEITALRHDISVIFQDYVQYYLTARENIWLGNIDLKNDHEKIIEAAKQAGVHELISGLPKGYDTTLGKWFDDGEELSLGEWQKIALARVFTRSSQLIVLDEPTSSMDAKSEFNVFSKFRNLLNNQSAIIISHRFSTVRMADRIYVIEKGKVLESGSHDELLTQNGKYAQLFEMQAQYYK